MVDPLPPSETPIESTPSALTSQRPPVVPRSALRPVPRVAAIVVALVLAAGVLPAGRSAILAYTMPIWTVLFSLALLHEPLSRRKVVGLVLGMIGMATLLGEDVRHLQRAPVAALLILGAAVSWAFGTVLLRKWALPLPQNVLSGWMMLLGWIPIALLAPLFDPGGLPTPTARGWFAILYNIFLAGTLAHWAWFTLARTLPVAVSSMASLPVPIVGVFAGMVVLSERPGPGEWTALAFVLAAMYAVLRAPAARSRR